ncbi:MAG: proliferating cell nuclear antigen (pcna) [Nanoarchaeota archaeon]
MKLTLAEPRYLKDSIAIISDLVTEASIKVTKQELSLIAMDPANVAMVDFKLLSSAFVEYDLKKDQSLRLNLGNLKQILRRAKPSDVLTLELVENKLKIKLKGTTTRTFSLSLIDMEEKEQRVPPLQFPVTVSAPTTVLNDAVEDVESIIADSVSFTAEPGVFLIEAETELSKAVVEIKADENTKITAKERCRAKYSLEYLKKMIPGAKLAERVTIQFNKDYPLKLDFVEINKLSLSFILAPRVEND